jgi:porphobilinogen deaminase
MTPLPALRLAAGSRTSKLARWQTDHIVARLQAAWPGLEVEVTSFVTAGDR